MSQLCAAGYDQVVIGLPMGDIGPQFLDG